MEKIAFYFRKNVLAQGDFSLYYRFATFFSEHYDCSVYCINNSFPELQAQYADSGIKFRDLDEQTKKELEGATFITAFNQIFFMLDEIKDIKNAKVMLLFLHPQIVPWLLSQVNPDKFGLGELLKLLKAKDAYGFMDKSNLLALSKFTEEKFEERYFPVTVEKMSEYEELPYAENDAENVAWFGRMDRDKIFSVTNFLDNLAETEKDKPIKIHFIGDGNGKGELKAENFAPDMLFYFTSYLYGQDCRDYMKKNADLVLAMGISALDAASNGIPTIIPIVSPVKFRDDKFVYIYDIKDYSLGWNKGDLRELGCVTHTAAEVLKDIYSNEGKRAIGRKCYDFVKENFSVEKSAESVYNLILGSSLTVDDLLECRSVKAQLKDYALYKKVRGKNGYAEFLAFRAKVKRFRAKGFFGKIKTVYKWTTGKIRAKTFRK